MRRALQSRGDLLDLGGRHAKALAAGVGRVDGLDRVALAHAQQQRRVAALDQRIEFAQVVLPPYTFPTPSIELVQQALSQDSLKVSEERVDVLKRERARLAAALREVPQVVHVYPSDANFILVRTRDGQAFRETARRANILVRTFDDPLLKDCVRITVGRKADNDLLVQAVTGTERKRHA